MSPDEEADLREKYRGPPTSIVERRNSSCRLHRRLLLFARQSINFRARVAEALALLPRLHVLGTTEDENPRHPLYVRADAPLVEWAPGIRI